MENVAALPVRPVYLLAGLILFAIVSMLSPASCSKSAHTSDPRLRQIDEMLDSQLPAGTPKPRVILYLNSQGFPIENAADPKTIAATIHHVDTETLKPVTASVTFHFDPQDRLTTYELTAR